MARYTLRVNGRSQAVEAEAGDALLFILREDLGLTAASFGKTTGQPGYSVQRDPDENGNINAIDLSIIAAVFGRKCTQA